MLTAEPLHNVRTVPHEQGFPARRHGAFADSAHTCNGAVDERGPERQPELGAGVGVDRGPHRHRREVLAAEVVDAKGSVAETTPTPGTAGLDMVAVNVFYSLSHHHLTPSPTSRYGDPFFPLFIDLCEGVKSIKEYKESRVKS